MNEIGFKFNFTPEHHSLGYNQSPTVTYNGQPASLETLAFLFEMQNSVLGSLDYLQIIVEMALEYRASWLGLNDKFTDEAQIIDLEALLLADLTEFITEEKILTQEEIQQMEYAEEGETKDGHFSDLAFLSFGRFAGVDSVARDLGLNPLIFQVVSSEPTTVQTLSDSQIGSKGSPVALDEIAGEILEADIPVQQSYLRVGSNLLSDPNTIGGTIVSDGTHYGPDGPAVGGGVTNISFVSVVGISNPGDISGITQFGTITQIQIDESQGALNAANLNNKSIVVTDSLGNQLVVDAITSQYYYILHQAFNDSVPDSYATVIFSYVLTDRDGQSASATLSVIVEDDHPYAVDIASDVSEANIPVVGSNNQPASSYDTVGGILVPITVSLSTARYGADGPGGIFSANLLTVNGGTKSDGSIITATSTVGAITQANIDSSNGAFNASNLGHSAIFVTDSIGNVLIVDQITSQYNYTLTAAFSSTIVNQPAFVVFDFTIYDDDGSIAGAQLTITVADDMPQANPDSGTAPVPAPSSICVTFDSSDAGYDNSYGYYIKDSNGDPTTGVIIWAGAKETMPGSMNAITGLNPDQVGYFIIPNGGALNPSLNNGDQVTFIQVAGLWQATLTTTSQPLIGQGASAYFDNISLNADGVKHVEIAPDGTQGWEDLYGGGDKDYNDLIVQAVNYNSIPNQIIGNLLINDIAGADGNLKVTEFDIQFSNIALAQNYIVNNPLLHATLNGSTVQIPIPTDINVSIPTPQGATVAILPNGSYVYTVFDTTQLGTETFTYKIVDGDNSPSSSTVTFEVTTGDYPAAVNETSAPINEANIPIVGSNVITPTNVNTVSGTLVPPSDYGADGPAPTGGVFNVSFVSVNGATNSMGGVITGTSVYGSITQTMIDHSQGAFTSANLGNNAVIVTDSIGNVLIMDQITSTYVYTLNAAFHDTIADQSAVVNFTFMLVDVNGNTAKANLAVTVLDDAPVALNWDSGTILEADIPVIGSNRLPATSDNTLGGILVPEIAALGVNRYGADGAFATGGVSQVAFVGVTGATAYGGAPINATTTFGNITQTMIDNSNGAFTAANLGHSAIIVTDSIGNIFIVDQMTSQYNYILSSPFYSTVVDQSALVTLRYELKDGDGSTSMALLTIDVTDDIPKAVSDVNAAVPVPPAIEITFESANAGYNNSYGYYIKNVNGEPSTGVIIWADAKQTTSGAMSAIAGLDPQEIGYFIIPNGGNYNPSLIDGQEVTFTQVGGIWQAVSTATGQPLLGQGAPAYFDNISLNPDGVKHVQIAPNGTQGWEDLYGGGDKDFNDLVVQAVDTTAITTDVKGNVLTNDISSADGHTQVVELDIAFASVELANEYITANPNLNATLSGTNVLIPIPTNSSTVIPTPDGATLEILSNGEYVYTVSYATQVGTENFTYKIVDGDNSPSSATLSFEVTQDAQNLFMLENETTLLRFDSIVLRTQEENSVPLNITSNEMRDSPMVIGAKEVFLDKEVIDFTKISHISPSNAPMPPHEQANLTVIENKMQDEGAAPSFQAHFSTSPVMETIAQQAEQQMINQGG